MMMFALPWLAYSSSSRHCSLKIIGKELETLCMAKLKNRRDIQSARKELTIGGRHINEDVSDEQGCHVVGICQSFIGFRQPLI